MELLPALGITCDWLLTTGEESGQSTAQDFETDKQYNWVIEFDRGGTDVVLYQYEDDHLVDLIEDCGARVGVGSYSDIADLDFLGCKAMNWGVGYADYHSERSHAWLEDTFRMVARFAKFYEANSETFLPHAGWGVEAEDVDDEYANWWKRSDIITADCGHEIDLSDTNSYIESQGGSLIECKGCGTIDLEGTA